MIKRISKSIIAALIISMIVWINYTMAARQRQYNVGLLVVATGKYIQFVKPLLDSAERYFCKRHKVTYFIFTQGQPPQLPNVVTIYQQRLGWPQDTLMRCAMYDDHKDAWKHMDYVFACDADMEFVAPVGDEILSERVATQHPGFVGRRGTYETRSISKAYVREHEGKQYFAGGFHGGSKTEFAKLVHTMHENIKTDLAKNIIAVWHDESHLNRYFISYPPTCILSPSYCYPGSEYKAKQWGIDNLKPKLVALEKDHAQVRA